MNYDIVSLAPPSNDVRSSIGSTCGAEHSLVGLAPQYWTYAPMSIATFHKLGFLNGLHCFLTHSENGLKFIPVSKCAIAGIIVNVDRLYNGARLYLLDDGSGVADCVAWSNDDSNIFSLPLLVPSSVGHKDTEYRVGDMVRIWGKIQCVSIGEVREVRSGAGATWKTRACIREVHVNLMQAISPNEAMSWNAEAQHWLNSLQLDGRLNIRLPLQSTSLARDGDHAAAVCIRNGGDILDLLGPEIAQQALSQDDFPSADDTLGAWRVFGASCKCRLDYMNSLLYCHCQATSENLDPQFLFRDHLLCTLLNLRDENSRSRSTCCPYCFQFKTLTNNDRITQVARELVKHTENPALYIHRLILRTFVALRADGILHLLDNETDTYMLICKENVMEPYFRTMADNQAVEAAYARKFPLEKLPTYFTDVPYERLQFVKRCVAAHSKVFPGHSPYELPKDDASS